MNEVATVRAALGLGSNLGDTKANLDQAVATLATIPGIRVIARSSDYRTPPWGPVAQDDYRNACLVVETSLPAHGLLDACLATEESMGRVRDVRWGPRLIDIDVLIYGDDEIDDDRLTLPHPRMSERSFVLVPLSEIWPDAPLGKGLTAERALIDRNDRDEIILLRNA